MGKSIQEIRKAKGLSQAELAEFIGTNQVVESRYEMGTQYLTIDTIQKIATALKTDISITFKA
ncbi:helix-turn-helix domain-containing protein [Spirosoma sp. KNUC1025]|uniref:helix-turn-helix domain-containing protein n=1 Tax=Spirosoma sp. KNUC1025 TaxID=2894082 RepID=UPI00387081C5